MIKPYTKSGIMAGLGEKDTEVYEAMDDLRNVGWDILTIGQYLQTTKQQKGFKNVAYGPFVRSSYNASLGIQEMSK